MAAAPLLWEQPCRWEPRPCDMLTAGMMRWDTGFAWDTGAPPQAMRGAKNGTILSGLLHLYCTEWIVVA